MVVCAHSGWDKGKVAKVSRKITEWDIDGLKSEEEKEKAETAEKYWNNKSSKRPVLDENSSGENLQREAEWIQQNFVNHLNRCCKKVKVCVGSKRWWMVEIAENRKLLGLTKKARRKGEASKRLVNKQ